MMSRGFYIRQDLELLQTEGVTCSHGDVKQNNRFGGNMMQFHIIDCAVYS